MKYSVLLFVLMSGCLFAYLDQNESKPKRIVVIDSGLDTNDKSIVYCDESLNKDLTETSIEDEIKHGSLVNHLIVENSKKSVCLIVIKYFDEQALSEINARRFLQALVYSKILNPDYVNLSGGGAEYVKDEYKLIESMPKTVFVVAAGNNGKNLDNGTTYYPAMYKLPNIIPVGALDSMGRKLSSSNYGSIIHHWQLGEYMGKKGTSFATPRQLAEIINE